MTKNRVAIPPGGKSYFGQRGVPADIQKHKLGIDLSYYQRKQHTRKIERICAAFCWESFGVLLVNERTKGSFYIIDGGHRHAATMKIAEITTVPCLLLTGLTQKQEAEQYVRINKERTALTGVEQWKGQVGSGQALYVAIQERLDNQAIKVGPNKKGASRDVLACPQTLLLICPNETHLPHLLEVLSFLLYGFPDDNDIWRQDSLTAVHNFAYHLRTQKGQVLSDPDVKRCFEDVMLKQLRKQANIKTVDRNVKMADALRNQLMVQYGKFHKGKNKLAIPNLES